ncbi:hypothetical protein HY440_03460 [Candidatus Microgenomates bacterium]|nr:hypothetical protein [Candidatus Microgenomates bacterium]
MPWRRANVCDDLHFMDYECRVFRLLNPSLVKAYLPGEKQTLENYIWQMRFKMTIASWLGRWPWGMGKSVNVLLSPR